MTVILGAEVAEKSLKQLKRLDLLEVGVSKLYIIPSMFNFIQNDISMSSKIDNIKQICQFYNKLLIDSYRNLGKSSSRKIFKQRNDDSPASTPLTPLDKENSFSETSKKMKSSLEKLG